jgi:hypothetical protein
MGVVAENKRGRKKKDRKASTGATAAYRSRALQVSVRRASSRAPMDYAGCWPTRGYAPPRASRPAPETFDTLQPPARVIDDEAARWRRFEATDRFGVRHRVELYLAWHGAGGMEVTALLELAAETWSVWLLELEAETAERISWRVLQFGYDDRRDATLGVAPVSFSEAATHIGVLHQATGERLVERALPTSNKKSLARQIERFKNGDTRDLQKNDTKFIRRQK